MKGNCYSVVYLIKSNWRNDINKQLSFFTWAPQGVRVIKCNRFPRQKGGHGPRHSMRGPWKLGTRPRSLGVQCFAENFLARVGPYTLMSHTKMSIVFRSGRSTNYSA